MKQYYAWVRYFPSPLSTAYPTGLFTILAPRDKNIGEFHAVRKRLVRRILKLKNVKGTVGYIISAFIIGVLVDSCMLNEGHLILRVCLVQYIVRLLVLIFCRLTKRVASCRVRKKMRFRYPWSDHLITRETLSRWNRELVIMLGNNSKFQRLYSNIPPMDLSRF